MKKVRWIVSLSNGETLYEERGNFKTIKGELSPWQRLLSYIAENELEIRSISLVHSETGRRYHVPSAGSSPKFHAFATAPKPIDYKFFRKIGADVLKGGVIDPDKADHFSVIEAVYSDNRVQLWVDEKNGNCWTLLT